MPGPELDVEPPTEVLEPQAEIPQVHLPAVASASMGEIGRAGAVGTGSSGVARESAKLQVFSCGHRNIRTAVW